MSNEAFLEICGLAGGQFNGAAFYPELFTVESHSQWLTA
jgi:hypothetical protein